MSKIAVDSGQMNLDFLKIKNKSLGATAIEYTLIASLIAFVCIGGYRRMGQKYTTLYNGITSGLDKADEEVANSVR